MVSRICVIAQNVTTDDDLTRLISTLKSQTFRDFSIAVLDDYDTCKEWQKITMINSKEVLEFIQNSAVEYVTFIDVKDSLFEDAFKKLFYAAKLTDADIAMGNYSDFSDGQYYFYPWGSDWQLQMLSGAEYLQKNATSDYQMTRLYGTLYGRLYHKRLFDSLTEWHPLQLHWQLALTANEVAYVNYPTYVYIPKNASVGSYYNESLTSFQNLLKEAKHIEDFSMSEARQEYIQQLANFTEWLNNEGSSKEAERTYNMLVTAENGLIPLVDLPSIDFTIISNNCVGGLIYKQMGLPYRTPFVGLFILPEDYYKLTKDFHYYMEQELVFDEELHYFAKDNLYYPVGHLDDVTLHFLHYDSIEEARTKWNRRKSRMNWKNVYFKFDDREGMTDELLHKVDDLPYHNKIILVHKDFQLQNQYIVPGHEVGFTEVGIINYPLQTFDVVSWLQRGGNDLSGGNLND